jgi:hypothetical protein
MAADYAPMSRAELFMVITQRRVGHDLCHTDNRSFMLDVNNFGNSFPTEAYLNASWVK